jgi:hypothetical protein
MSIYMFRQPYLDGDDGVNLGGGGTPTEAAEQQTTTQPTDTTGQEGQQTEPPKFKVKFNHEERELTYDEAIQYAQKGLNYDRIYPEYEKLRNNPHMSYLEQKAQKLGITIDQLIENDRKYEEQEALNQLVQQNIPQEYAKEMLENRKFREQYTTEQKAQQERETRQKMYGEFLDAYPDVKTQDIPPEVWQEVKAGRSLLDAYVRHENKMLKDKLNGAQQQQQTQQANQANAAASTGSARASGMQHDVISEESINAHANDTAWMLRNYNKIEEFYKKKKG